MSALASACQTKSSSPSSEQGEASQSAPINPVLALPTLPGEQIKRLQDSLESIDYLFYGVEISLNVGGADAKSNLGYFTDTPASPTPNCSPTCKMNFVGFGKVLITCDVYFGNGCNYGVFYHNGVRYGQTLSQAGINFFVQINQQIHQRTGQ